MTDSLIKRLDAAERGSRELDGHIWWLVDRRAAERAYWNAGDNLTLLEGGYDENTISKPLSDAVPKGIGYIASTGNAPHYTNSLDAKIPGENIVHMNFNNAEESDTGMPNYIVMHVDKDDPTFERSFIGTHAVEAIARRIAALKAMVR